jgi:cephalosporin hydroxylase
MDPVSQFQRERADAVEGYKKDSEFQTLSQDWLRESMQRRYVYNFDWLGRPIIQYPQDMAAVQELIWSTRPDVVIETGIAHGGSLILSASFLALLDLCDATEAGEMLDPRKPKRRVIGIDIDIRPHNRAGIDAHPMASRIQMFEGSSIDPFVVEQVREAVGDAARVMVCLDSMHTHEHVLAELEAYGSMVTTGCALVVFDSFVENMPGGFFADRPWDVGDNPMTALQEWLPTHPEFEVDRSMDAKLQISVAPNGYLRRVR